MIDKYFAEQFIEKIREYMPEEKFMVFNNNGIIIAATEEERVGVFHEASYNMIKNNMDFITVLPEEITKYLGVKPGIDMLVKHNGEIMGGVGITGDTKRCRPLITLAKLMMEAMLQYEFYMEQTALSNSKFDEMCDLLLNYNKETEQNLVPLAQELSLLTHIPRICILFRIPEGFGNPSLIYETLEEYNRIDDQDIFFIYKSREVLLFKTLPFVKKDIFGGYKDYLNDWIGPLRTLFLRKSIPVFIYIGSMQTHLQYYKYAYGHCLWMQSHGYQNKSFYDYMNSYIQELIPATEINAIYDSISGLLTNSMRENFTEVFQSLNTANYNLAEACELMHVHKNTLVFHLDKYRELFHMNPLKSSVDRAFFDYFVTYLTNVKKGRLE